MATKIEITEKTKRVLRQLRNISQERTDWQECKQDTKTGQEIVMKVRPATP